LACNLARATHAPNLVMIYEFWCGRRDYPSGSGLHPAIPRWVNRLADGVQHGRRLSVACCRTGEFEVGFLGGAQVDRYGNINTTVGGELHEAHGALPGAEAPRKLRFMPAKRW
jgi:glutaconate CoA-transferase subunit B